MYEVVGKPILSFVLDPRQKMYGQLVGAQNLVGKMPASIVLPDTLVPETIRLVQKGRDCGWHARRLLIELREYLDDNIQRVRALSLDYGEDGCKLHLITADDFEQYDYYWDIPLT